MKGFMARANAISTARLPAGAVGLKQLAEQLDLGVSTVSHALRGDGTVSEATRRRVREHAARVGYTANAHARRTRSRRTMIVGLVIPDVVGAYSEFVQHAFRQVAASGRELQVALSEFDAGLEDHALRTLMGQRVDGILIKSCFQHWDEVPAGHALRAVVASRVPAVIVGEEVRGSGLACCRTPTELHARMLVRHAVGAGHRRVDWLLPIDARAWPLDRLPQHKRAFAAAGDEGQRLAGRAFRLRLRTLDTLDSAGPAAAGGGDYGNYINESLPARGAAAGRALAAASLGGPAPATALICANDVTAIGAMHAAGRLGLEVPGDVLVGAYHATPAAHLAPAPLVVAAAAPEAVARHALGLLAQSAEGRDPPSGFPPPALSVVGGPT